MTFGFHYVDYDYDDGKLTSSYNPSTHTHTYTRRTAYFIYDKSVTHLNRFVVPLNITRLNYGFSCVCALLFLFASSRRNCYFLLNLFFFVMFQSHIIEAQWYFHGEECRCANVHTRKTDITFIDMNTF